MMKNEAHVRFHSPLTDLRALCSSKSKVLCLVMIRLIITEIMEYSVAYSHVLRVVVIILSYYRYLLLQNIHSTPKKIKIQGNVVKRYNIHYDMFSRQGL